MKRLALALPPLAAATWSAALLAQGVQGTMPPVAPPPGAAAPPPSYQKVVEGRPAVDYPLPSAADPRVCLEFPTNAQVIACAERYRPHRRRA